ncbi:MAG: hypothetical protein BMS9Abin36_1173 [Gammaproteobacteria bacterium]|nr:MAG: hypothetical protein BMS9Abin36_1173 [Gammaproteobacteria bacterium]
MLKKIIHAVCALLLIIGLVSAPSVYAGKLNPIYEPETMELAGDASIGAVREGIMRAIKYRKWKGKKVGKRTIRATFKKVGKVSVVYKAIVDIKYSRGKIKINYHSSRGLDYQKESGLISGYYNRWVKKLEKEIWREVNR